MTGDDDFCCRVRRGASALAAALLIVATLTACDSVGSAAKLTPSGSPATLIPAPTVSTDAEGDTAQLLAVHDGGVYGISADVSYVPSTAQHLMTAAAASGGLTLHGEMYQAGANDDGPPQQPKLRAKERLSISLFAVPDCRSASPGAQPTLALTLTDATGAPATRTVPVADLQRQLARVVSTWCSHGVMAAMESSDGPSDCLTKADFLVRNPRLQRASLTLTGGGLEAPRLDVAAGGHATWHLTAGPSCSASSRATATVQFADGSAETLDLPYS